PVRPPRGVEPARIDGAMVARVPAVRAEVEAAGERDGVVDDDDLLMMARADRMAAVETEAQSAVSAPPEFHERQRLALERVDHRKVPVEDVRVQVAALRHDCVQEIAEATGQGVRDIGTDAYPTIDVPAENQDRAFCTLERGGERPEVRIAVDEEGDAIGVLTAPAVPPRRDDRGGRLHASAIRRALYVCETTHRFARLCIGWSDAGRVTP